MKTQEKLYPFNLRDAMVVFAHHVPSPSRLPPRCRRWSYYLGYEKPRCNGGGGCVQCWWLYLRERSLSARRVRR